MSSSKDESTTLTAKPPGQFSVRFLLFAVLAVCSFLGLVVQLRHIGVVAFFYLAGVVASWRRRDTRTLAASVTALLVFAITYLACWTQIGYLHLMGSPHPYVPGIYARTIQDALQSYVKQNGTLPDSLSELKTIPSALTAMQSWSMRFDGTNLFDWWDHPIQYEKILDGYSVVSLGRDGKVGGVGLDADLLVAEEIIGYNSIGLPLKQFLFDTHGSEPVFWMALLGSLAAGGIWCIPRPRRKTSITTMLISVVVTSISAAALAAILAAFHVVASQSSH